jgi:hypothetical protein
MARVPLFLLWAIAACCACICEGHEYYSLARTTSMASSTAWQSRCSALLQAVPVQTCHAIMAPACTTLLVIPALHPLLSMLVVLRCRPGRAAACWIQQLAGTVPAQ